MSEASKSAPAPAPAPAPKEKKKKGRGSNATYDREEQMHLFEIISDVLPISGDDWDEVLSRHNEKYASKNRDIVSIRRKFSNTHKIKCPTGNPYMPDHVRPLAVFPLVSASPSTIDVDASSFLQ